LELLREEEFKKENINKNKIKKNDKNKEKENKADIEKFQDIYINFYTSRINENNSKNIKHRNTNLNNTFLPSIKSERNLNKKDSFLMLKLTSRNMNKLKLNEKIKKNKSQINLLMEQNNSKHKIFKLKSFSKMFIKDTTKETYLFQNDTNKKNEKEKINTRDVFIKFFKKYAINNRILNTSLIFNKIKIKGKEENKNNININLNQSSLYSQSKSNINNRDESLISRNPKLPSCNSNDNIFSVSQKLSSKKVQTLIISNQLKYLEKRNNYKPLIDETNKDNKENENEIKSYTERKIINKKINHPYYSPSVLAKKVKYGFFSNNNKLSKDEQNKIIIKSNKDFGFFHFDFENPDSN
jgi:hypothetical protein